MPQFLLTAPRIQKGARDDFDGLVSSFSSKMGCGVSSEDARIVMAQDLYTVITIVMVTYEICSSPTACRLREMMTSRQSKTL